MSPPTLADKAQHPRYNATRDRPAETVCNRNYESRVPVAALGHQKRGFRTMSNTCRLIILISLLAPQVGCKNDDKPTTAAEHGDGRATERSAEPRAIPQTAPATPSSKTNPSPPPPSTLQGTVLETMDAASYTYLLIDTDQGRHWAAARKMDVAVGDVVRLAGPMPMRNFQSKTLNRTFDEIFFVSAAVVVTKGGSQAPTTTAPQAMPSGHPSMGSAVAQPKPGASPSLQPGDIPKLPDGYTVGELFARKTELASQLVKLRGVVVKANKGIMGKNWIHLQDGTGEQGTNDITVTSKTDYAAPGAVVIVEGTLAMDKDVGSGYFFPVIIEDASILPEPTDSEPDEASSEAEKPASAPGA